MALVKKNQLRVVKPYDLCDVTHSTPSSHNSSGVTEVVTARFFIPSRVMSFSAVCRECNVRGSCAGRDDAICGALQEGARVSRRSGVVSRQPLEMTPLLDLLVHTSITFEFEHDKDMFQTN